MKFKKTNKENKNKQTYHQPKVGQLTRKTSHLLKAGMPLVTDDTGKGYKLR